MTALEVYQQAPNLSTDKLKELCIEENKETGDPAACIALLDILETRLEPFDFRAFNESLDDPETID